MVEAGAHAVGFPFDLDTHAEDCTLEQARLAAQAITGKAAVVLVTYATALHRVIELTDILGADMIQFHGHAEPDLLRRVLEVRPGLLLVKSVVLGRDEDPLDLVKRFSGVADALLTDTFDPATGASGATGKTHDWEVSAGIVETCCLPLILAGGLTPDNVRRAVKVVRPFGVDAHTGVEDAFGDKNPDSMRDFVSQARASFAAVQRPAGEERTDFRDPDSSGKGTQCVSTA